MNRLGLVFLFLLLAGAPGQAAADKMSWKQFKSAVKKDCDAFSEAMLASPASHEETPYKRYPPRYPDDEQMLPYVCIGLNFDVNGEGRTENINVVFKSPSDAGAGFEREAIRSVERWRYGRPENAEQRIAGQMTLITYEAR